MNAAGMEPSEGTVSSNDASRRTFLKGVGLAGVAGLAGAAGLTGPFLAGTRAGASIAGLILGANRDAWVGTPTDAPAGAQPLPKSDRWPARVPGALGSRVYLDAPFSKAADCPTRFPGVQVTLADGTSVVSKPLVSIRPDPRVLLNPNHAEQPGFDNQIKALILDGARSFSAPKLTVWHEAGNLYGLNGTAKNGVPWTAYGVARGQTPVRIDGKEYGPAQLVRSMHVKMKKLCDEVKANHPELAGDHVEYGCVIYGEIALMASSGPDQENNWVPNAGFPLDWYGIDVYYESDPPKWTRGNLNSPTAVADYMGRWLQVARQRSKMPDPTIHVCECNANASNGDARPQFFKNLASWLNNNGGRNPHMLTFFPPAEGRPHSVPWDPAQGRPGQPTITALNSIQAAYG